MMATGAALGTGSAVAHRAVDGLMGGRGESAAPQEAQQQQAQQYYPQQSYNQQQDPCELQMKQFTDCVSRTGGDMSACNIYFDSMQSCKARFNQLPQQLQ